LPSADSLLKIAAHSNPRKFYDYAAVSDRLGAAYAVSRTLLCIPLPGWPPAGAGSCISRLSTCSIHEKITLDDIDKVKDDNLAYFKLLVKTRIDFAGRMMVPQKDTPMEMQSLTRMMANKAKQAFIREINGLHDQPTPFALKAWSRLLRRSCITSAW